MHAYEPELVLPYVFSGLHIQVIILSGARKIPAIKRLLWAIIRVDYL